MNVKWDPITWTFVYCMHQDLVFFCCKYWPDDGLLRPKLVANNRIFIYLLTAIGLTLGCSRTVHIYAQTIHRTTQLATLVGRLFGIGTQSAQTEFNDKLTK